MVRLSVTGKFDRWKTAQLEVRHQLQDPPKILNVFDGRAVDPTRRAPRPRPVGARMRGPVPTWRILVSNSARRTRSGGVPTSAARAPNTRRAPRPTDTDPRLPAQARLDRVALVAVRIEVEHVPKERRIKLRQVPRCPGFGGVGAVPARIVLRTIAARHDPRTPAQPTV